MLDRRIEARYSALSPIYAEFLRRSHADPRSWRDSPVTRLQTSAVLGQAHALQPWPVIVQRDAHAALQRSSAELVTLIRSLPARLFGNSVERFCARLGMPCTPDLAEAFGPRSGLAHSVARTDLVLTALGPRLLEVNFGPGIGGWDVYFLEASYRADPHLAGFLAEQGCDFTAANPMRGRMRHAFETGIACFEGLAPGEAINVAVGVPASTAACAARLMPTAPLPDPRKGERFQFSEAAEILVRDGRTFIDGRLAHVVLCQDVDQPVPPALAAAQRQGAVLLLNGVGAALLGRKSVLALLSELEDSDLLSPAERALVTAVLPWTRQGREGPASFRGSTGPMREVLLRHQDDLVLKPEDGYGGSGVLVGAHATAPSWRHAVDEALDGGAIAQEHCPSVPFLAPHGDRMARQNAVWSVFVHGEASAGSWVRMMPQDAGDGVLNCARGAAETIVLEHA